ncbi:MAG: hypothetical protein IKT57_07550 [Clostridia bacterium]|nr:hypothetical protein [Clostridia bacterium]
MKKMIALILALMMMFSLALAEDTAETKEVIIPRNVKVHLSLEGTVADGFIAIPQIKNSDTVSLQSMHYEYGFTDFVFSADNPGEAIVVLQYGKPAEQFVAKQEVYMISVTEDGQVFVQDMTEQLPLIGTVKEVTEDGVLLETVEQGDILCRLPEGMDAPAENDLIQVWHNGAMTMSLPAQVGVLAWELVTMQAR